MASLSNTAFTALLRIIGRNKKFRTAGNLQKAIRNQTLRPASYFPPRRLDSKAHFSIAESHGWSTYTVTPKIGAVGTRVLYFHGGGFVAEISPFHWSLIARFAERSGAEVTVPIYDLAPGSDAETTVARATELAAELIAKSQLPLTLMGDSAGGTISLAVAQQLRDQGVQPHQIILISPLVDATLSDPRMLAIEPHDPMLAIPGARECGRVWANNLDIKDPRVSPLYGDFAGLAPITLFSGTADILNIDAHLLVEKLKDLGISVKYHEAEQAQHVYPLFPTREGAEARRVIARLLRSRPGVSARIR